MLEIPIKEDLEKLSYQELLKAKNCIMKYLDEFENDFDMKSLGWDLCPSPDVMYQHYLEYLGMLAPLLSAAFNKEYECGDKSIENYYEDMKGN